jgi:hypothetical protein
MKAIVLTYDRNQALTEHMIHRYQELWPGNPFCFRIPFQSETRLRQLPQREYVAAPAPIYDTMQCLLEDLPDEEMVFWCIDDKYPVYVDGRMLEKVISWIGTDACADVDGISVCRSRKLLDPNNLTGNICVGPGGIRFRERKAFSQIWVHQFSRVKVLRTIFSAFPRDIHLAKEMDFWKNQIAKPADLHLYVTERSYLSFGESASRGGVTKNCYQSMRKHHLELPAWHTHTTPHSIFIGTKSANWKWKIRDIKNWVRRKWKPDG